MAQDCPGWCAGNHPTASGERGPDQEVVHATEADPVPVVALLVTEGGERELTAGELEVALFQFQGDPMVVGPAVEEEWVFVGSDYQGLTVTRESAERLYRTLGKLLTSTALCLSGEGA